MLFYWKNTDKPLLISKFGNSWVLAVLWIILIALRILVAFIADCLLGVRNYCHLGIHVRYLGGIDFYHLRACWLLFLVSKYNFTAIISLCSLKWKLIAFPKVCFWILGEDCPKGTVIPRCYHCLMTNRYHMALNWQESGGLTGAVRRVQNCSLYLTGIHPGATTA